MRLTPIALLMMAALPGSHGPSSPSLDIPDVTLKTRRTLSGPQAISTIMALQIKGPRRRTSSTFERAGVPTADPSVHLTQCDLKREVLLNGRTRIYAITPTPARGARRPVASDMRPISETVTVDAVDTRERRTFGPFTARHVVTTMTRERAGQSAPVSTRVQDGWYLDLPSGCDADDIGAAVLMGGSASGRIEVKWKGTARSGWAVTEKITTVEQDYRSEATTTLVEFTAAPLDPALFEVPPGYRSALPLGDGGFDMEQPDTVVNRVRHAVESAASWVHYTWSRMTSPGPTARMTAQ